MTIKSGDYFYTSWGYDQTNIDYLVVVGVSPSDKTVTCRMADPINIGEEGHEDVLMPGVARGETFTMHVRGDSLRGSYPFMRNMRDKRPGIFFKTIFGEVKHQTAAGYGH